MSDPLTSLVIVTYGRWELLARLLASIEPTTPQPHEIVVVDNDSPDETADRLRAEWPEVVLVEPEQNLGFGAGANLGIRRAKGRDVVLLNSDVELTTGWLPPLLDALNQPGVAIAAPVSVDADGEAVEAGAEVTSDGHVHVRAAPVSPRPFTAPHASAACWAMRRSWFERVGGFDARYGLGYYEDLDLTSYLAARGECLVVVPASRVRHDVGGSFDSGLAQWLSHRNQLRCKERWRWTRRDLPRRPGGHLSRPHGSVAIVGFEPDVAAAMVHDLAARQLIVHVLDHDVDTASIEQELMAADPDVTVLGPLADAPVVALRCEVCGPGEIDAALVAAGVAPSSMPRRPRGVNMVGSTREGEVR